MSTTPLSAPSASISGLVEQGQILTTSNNLTDADGNVIGSGALTGTLKINDTPVVGQELQADFFGVNPFTPPHAFHLAQASLKTCSSHVPALS